MKMFWLISVRPLPNIDVNATWMQNGVTVAGGHGQGNRFNQLSLPRGLCVDEDRTLYIADYDNHRIVQWRNGAMSGQVVAGGNGPGNRTDQFHFPADVTIDKETDSLIICDRDNRRVMRWSRLSGINGETIISNIGCYGLTIDDHGFLYVSDIEKHEVRRYRLGDTSDGTLVAGGNGEGNRLDQLHSPTYVVVDQDHSVYVSEVSNNRVMKWVQNAEEGIVVAGGQGGGNALTQLSNPQGVIVDGLHTIYVADQNNHRVTRWYHRATQGNVIAGGNDEGEGANQLNYIMALSFDRDGNLYVVDHGNHRVQRFDIEQS